MKTEEMKKEDLQCPHGKYHGRTLQIVIVFWLGVLTGVVAIILALMLRGGFAQDGKASLLYNYTSPLSNYLNTGGYNFIPTPPGGITSIPTPPGGITP